MEATAVAVRLVAGLVVAAACAAAARRARALSRSGAVAAVAIGTASVAAGWAWGTLLVAFFVSSSGLSRVGARQKAERLGGYVAKGDERDAIQVCANGGWFALCSVMSVVHPWPGWHVLGLGALATATADTWATEVGILAPGPPRSIVTARHVPPGTSGGVTLWGTFAALAGASFIGALAHLLGWPAGAPLAAAVGGIGGATADSLLGALLQTRRRCATCRMDTEQHIHSCGTPTDVTGGLAWMGNDAVNLLSGAVGALLAVLVVRVFIVVATFPH